MSQPSHFTSPSKKVIIPNSIQAPASETLSKPNVEQMNEDKDERKIHDVSHDSLDLPLSKRNDETVIGTPSTPTSQMRNMKKDSGGRRRRQNTRGSLRLKKAPGAPRRFRSAFIFFSTSKHQEFRTKILVQHGAGFGKSNSKEKVRRKGKERNWSTIDVVRQAILRD